MYGSPATRVWAVVHTSSTTSPSGRTKLDVPSVTAPKRTRRISSAAPSGVSSPTGMPIRSSRASPTSRHASWLTATYRRSSFQTKSATPSRKSAASPSSACCRSSCGPASTATTLYGRQLDDKPRAGRLAPLVPEVAAMRLRVGAGDREPEARAGDAVACDAGAREAVEERLLELLGDAGARVLDRDAERPVHGRCGHPHRRAAVPQRVRDQVRDDVVEDLRVDECARRRRHLDLDLVRARARGDRHHLVQARREVDALRPHVDRLRVETR